MIDSSKGGIRLRRRTSTGSMPISAANRSIARSIAAAASGRPAPRYAPVGVVLVTNELLLHSTFGIAYTPGDIIRVRNGSTAPIAGYAPESWTTDNRYASTLPC